MAHPAVGLENQLADRKLQPLELADLPDDGEFLPVGGDVRVRHVLQDLARRAAPQRHACEGAAAHPVAAVHAAEKQCHLAGPGDSEHRGAGGQVESPRLDRVEARHVRAQRLVPPGRPEDDGLSVGREPRVLDEAAVIRDLADARRGRRTKAAAEKQPGPERDDDRGGGERRRQHPAGRSRRRADARRTLAAHRRLERKGEVARRVEPVFGLLLQAVAQNPLDRGSEPARRLRELRRVLLRDRGHRLGRRVAAEGPFARRASRRRSSRGKRCPSAGPRASRAPARATCSPPSPSPYPVPSPSASATASPSAAADAALARPKSRIFTRPSDVTKRFSGFRSRWTIPFSCAAASPCAICIPYSKALRCGIGPSSSRWRSVSPSRSSMTRRWRPEEPEEPGISSNE